MEFGPRNKDGRIDCTLDKGESGIIRMSSLNILLKAATGALAVSHDMGVFLIERVSSDKFRPSQFSMTPEHMAEYSVALKDWAYRQPDAITTQAVSLADSMRVEAIMARFEPIPDNIEEIG